MLDVQLCETGSGGDLVLFNDDIKLIDDIGNQPYLAWFGGNPDDTDWWGNDLLLSDDSNKFISETETALNDNNLTSAGRFVIENTAKKDLDYFRDSAEIEVDAVIQELDRINITAKIETDFYNIQKAWDCTGKKQDVISLEGVYITEWTVPSGSFTFPAGNTGVYDGMINFGNGSGWKPFSAYNDANFTQNYVAGTYQILIKGSFPWFNVNNGAVKTYIDEVIQWGNVGFEKIENMFFGCINLTTIPQTQIPANPITATSAEDLFRGCSNLAGSFPDLSNLINLQSLNSSFRDCTNITGDFPILKYNLLLEDISRCFEECVSVTGIMPPDMFEGLSNLTTLELTFYLCSGVTGGFPDLSDLTSLITFRWTWLGCSNITGSLPVFDNNTLVTDYSSTFSGCTNISGIIPDEIFRYNTAVTKFDSTFKGCKNLNGSVPSFTYNVLVVNFNRTFDGCIGLDGSIPLAAFENCTLVTLFTLTFNACVNLIGSIPNFDNNTLVTSFQWTFLNCASLNGTINNTFVNNTLVIDFTQMFSGCSLLTGISNDLWLKGNNNLVGPDYDLGTPDGDNCYRSCTGLSDFVSIPTYWK